MASNAVIIPCAVLGSLVALMLVFIWWWFPRTWKKGNKMEHEEIVMSLGNTDDDGLTQGERLQIAGQHAREYLQAIEARNKARAEGREYNEPPPVYLPYERTHSRNIVAIPPT